jgi:hypothetical protein
MKIISKYKIKLIFILIIYLIQFVTYSNEQKISPDWKMMKNSLIKNNNYNIIDYKTMKQIDESIDKAFKKLVNFYRSGLRSRYG